LKAFSETQGGVKKLNMSFLTPPMTLVSAAEHRRFAVKKTEKQRYRSAKPTKIASKMPVS